MRLGWLWNWLRAAVRQANVETKLKSLSQLERRLRKEASRLAELQAAVQRQSDDARREVAEIRSEMERMQDHYEHALAKERQRIEIHETITIPMLTERLELEEARVRAQTAIQARIQMQDVTTGTGA